MLLVVIAMIGRVGVCDNDNGAGCGAGLGWAGLAAVLYCLMSRYAGGGGGGGWWQGSG